MQSTFLYVFHLGSNKDYFKELNSQYKHIQVYKTMPVTSANRYSYKSLSPAPIHIRKVKFNFQNPNMCYKVSAIQ